MIQPLAFRLRHFFYSDAQPLSTHEQWRSALGALLGLGATALLTHHYPVGLHWLLAPLGASTVILFMMPHSPVAAPWPVIGSYLASIAASLICLALIPYQPLAVAGSVALCIWLMARFNCIHPPGGAAALLLTISAPYAAGEMPWMILDLCWNVALLLVGTLLVNNLLLKRPYPYHPRDAIQNIHHTRDASPRERLGLTHEDLEHALRAADVFVDVQEGELVELYNRAVDHAFERHTRMTCGDIMSRDVVSVEYGTDLAKAWEKLRAHHIRALPVVDAFGRLQGILTLMDFLRELDQPQGLRVAERWQALVRPTSGASSDKPEVAGQLMTSKVYTARPDTPISELVQILAEHDFHHIPVVDDTRKVVGIVTHSDINAALYKQVALSTP
jgi:CBS domain-containing membrane protein